MKRDYLAEWETKVGDVLTDPAASWWLKGSLAGAVHHADKAGGYTHRDPVDVKNDLYTLNELINEWFELLHLGISPLLSPAFVGRDYPLPAHKGDGSYIIESDYKVRIHAYKLQTILPFLSIAEAEELALRDIKHEVHDA